MDRSKGERTFEMFSTNGRNAQNGRRSKVEIIAQADKKKKEEGEQFSNIDNWRIWENEGFQPQKLENGGKPKGRAANAPNHQAPGGHVACNAATMHLIRSKTPRVTDSSEKPFTFYDRHDVSWQP